MVGKSDHTLRSGQDVGDDGEDLRGIIAVNADQVVLSSILGRLETESIILTDGKRIS